MLSAHHSAEEDLERKGLWQAERTVRLKAAVLWVVASVFPLPRRMLIRLVPWPATTFRESQKRVLTREVGFREPDFSTNLRAPRVNALGRERELSAFVVYPPFLQRLAPLQPSLSNSLWFEIRFRGPFTTPTFWSDTLCRLA